MERTSRLGPSRARAMARRALRARGRGDACAAGIGNAAGRGAPTLDEETVEELLATARAATSRCCAASGRGRTTLAPCGRGSAKASSPGSSTRPPSSASRRSTTCACASSIGCAHSSSPTTSRAPATTPRSRYARTATARPSTAGLYHQDCTRPRTTVLRRRVPRALVLPGDSGHVPLTSSALRRA